MSFRPSLTKGVRGIADKMLFSSSPGDPKSDEANYFEPGDILQFFSNASCVIHYAVYLGKKLVAHLTPSQMCECKKSKETADENEAFCRTCKKSNHGKGQVQIQNIADMMKKEAYQKVKKDPWQGENTKRLSPDEIFQRALSMVGPVNYRVLTLNCEHFATWCAYDKPRSFQSHCVWKFGEEFKEQLTKDVLSTANWCMKVSEVGQVQNPEPAADHPEEHGEWREISLQLE